MSQSTQWKDELRESMPTAWADEIDVFETQIELRKQGKIDERLFAETRLRRGVYGQRYDNGQRHDGERSQTLDFPRSDLTKGPSTLWDAPGMMRIKVPFGKLSAEQLDVLAELGEEYSDAILHVTTRQDIQLHFVHIEDTPDLMRRLAAVGNTTREACGNAGLGVLGPGYEGSVRDEDGNELPVGQPGRLWIRAPSNMIGYWNRPDATAETIVDGWLDTGDVMHVDEDGYFRFDGRKKQIIVHDGSNISPQEVEEAVLAHEAVASAGVVGVHDLMHGENVWAYITLKEGVPRPTSQDVIRRAREQVGYKAPEVIVSSTRCHSMRPARSIG
jgi:acyl-CoA synthetase (AMP-forming)/AMP-acid ligase II